MRKSALALLEAYEKRQAEKTRSQVCAKCQESLQETLTGNRPTDEGCVCSDCYYEALGELVEQHPIVGARAHRG